MAGRPCIAAHLFALACMPVAVGAQAQVAASDDPFVQGAAALAAAGYVSHGPFAFGDGGDTRDVERAIGNGRICWLETEHFKIGCSLAPFQRAGGKEGADVEAELARLGKRLLRVDPKERTMSTWLRTHLFAQRVEDLYADFQKRMGVGDASSPVAAADARAKRDMGNGPYLGQRGKFLLLLLDHESTFGRVVKAIAARDERVSIRHLCVERDSLLFATSEEFAAGRLRDDRAMHCHVVFNVVHNLLNGYRHYSHHMPAWFCEGFAQWHLRRFDPSFDNYTSLDRFCYDGRKIASWQKAARGYAEHGAFTPAAKLLAWTDCESMTLADRVTIWSRVDYLMSLGDARLRAFVERMKEPLGGSPTPDELLARQRDALRVAWDLDAERLDKRWAEWVKVKPIADSRNQ